MAYRVNVTVRAERDLLLLFWTVNASQSQAALMWYPGLKEAILSLDQRPNRCPATPENPKLRHLLYGHKPHVCRVIFRITEKTKQVEVLHIRHGARERFKRSDVR